MNGWSYENELRLLKDRTGKIQYEKSALRNVILGFKVKDDFIDKVLNAVAYTSSDVGVYIMNEPKDLEKISYTKIH